MDMKDNSNSKKTISSSTGSSNKNDSTVNGERTFDRNLQGAAAAVQPDVAENNSNNNRNNNTNVQVHIIPLDNAAVNCINTSDSCHSRNDTIPVPCVKRSNVQLQLPIQLPMKKRLKNSCIQGATAENTMVNHGCYNKANKDGVIAGSIANVSPSCAFVNHCLLPNSCTGTVNSSPSITENNNSQISLKTDNDMDDIPVDALDDIDDDIVSMVLSMDDTRRVGNEIGTNYIKTQVVALRERLASYLLVRQQQEEQLKQQQKEKVQKQKHTGSIDKCQPILHPSSSSTIISTNQHDDDDDDKTTTSTSITTTTTKLVSSDFFTDLLEVERQSILLQATKIRNISIQFRTINNMYTKLMDELLMIDK